MNKASNTMIKSFGFESEEEVLEVVRNPKNNIEFIRITFPDILGRAMNFTIPSYELDKAFKDGKGFDGSSVEGFVRIEESDLVIKPDARTFRILPWEYEGFHGSLCWREAVMFGDILKPDGSPYEGDSRYILKRVLERGNKEYGVDDIMVGPELEFFIFPSKNEAVPSDNGGYFFGGDHGDLRKEVQLLLKKMGIDSEYDHHEVAHGQHEIDLRYLHALEMADVGMLFRYMVEKSRPKCMDFMPRSCPNRSMPRTAAACMFTSLCGETAGTYFLMLRIPITYRTWPNTILQG